MLRTSKNLLKLLEQKDARIIALEKSLEEMRVLARYVEKSDNNGLPYCDKPVCVACAHAFRFRDSDGGFCYRCTKDADCPDFRPRAASISDQISVS